MTITYDTICDSTYVCNDDSCFYQDYCNIVPDTSWVCPDSQYGCYHLKPSATFPTSLDRIGGQSQHVRTRLIQLLNEYYGDWKWVNDPTAKVNIICHSNGGLATTYALAYDKLYHNVNFAYAAQDHTGNCWNDPQYHITGLGFRLADHVNQVVTLDTPFEGSPMADKDGNVGTQGKALLEPIVNAVIEPILPTIMYGSPLANQASLLLRETLKTGIMEWAYDLLVNGAGTPIMRDFGPGSSFSNSFKAADPPVRSDGVQVPYFNIIGRTGQLAATCGALKKPMLAHGTTKMFLLQYRIGRQILGIAKWCATTEKWCNNSDFIVPLHSQDMKSVFPASTRKRHLIDDGLFSSTHMTISKEAGVGAAVWQIASDGGPSDGRELEVTHIIGENHPDEQQYATIKKTTNVSCGATPVPDPSHSFVRFDGMCGATGSRWLTGEVDPSGVPQFRPNLSTGKPVKIVAYLKDYFMNSGNVTLQVNGGAVDTVRFYDVTQDPPTPGVGSWASRFVDSDNDGAIGSSDRPGGCWVFADVNPADFKAGENLVVLQSLRYGHASGPKKPWDKREIVTYTTKAPAIVLWGTVVQAFEADDDGNERGEYRFLRQSVRWDIGHSEVKRVLIGFRSQIDGAHDGDSVWIGTPAGEEALTRVYDRTPDAGEFQFRQIGSKWYAEVALGAGQLSLDSIGRPAVDQILHLQVVDSQSNPASIYLPFYIDNEPPVIRVLDPTLLGDYNTDGVIDNQDQCVEVVDAGLGPACEQVCDSFGIADDPLTSENECDAAKAACRTGGGTSVPAEMHRPDCDGADNDFDGAADGQDRSEWKDVKFYSPSFDSSGECTNPVPIEFQVDESPDLPLMMPVQLQWRIFKAAGDVAETGDQLVYTSPVIKDVGFGEHGVASWDYAPYSQNALPEEGLYYAVVSCHDYAGWIAGQVTESAPAYFIIDRTAPSITVLQDWQDENGSTSLLPSSQTFRFGYKPGTASGYLPNRFDSETDALKIVFHPKSGPFSFVGPIEYLSSPGFDDVVTYTLGSGFPGDWDDSDGDIDPTFFELPMNGDFDGFRQSQTAAALERTLGLTGSKLVEAMSKLRLEAWKRLLLDGQYTVEYVATDRAGNTRRYFDSSKVVDISAGNDSPPLDESGVGIGDFNSYSDEEGQWTSTGNSDPDAENDTTDNGNFLWLRAHGDFSLTIRVTGLDNTGANCAGLMARTELDPGSVFAAVMACDNGGATFEYRPATNSQAVTGGSGTGYVAPNVWLKLERESGIVYGYASANGTTFTKIGQFSLETDTLYLGIFHRNGAEVEGSTVVMITGGNDVPAQPVSPVLEGVVDNCNGAFTATFGYNNPNQSTVTIPIGPRNKFSGTPSENAGQPTAFAPGRKTGQFTVTFTTGPVVWNLDGHTSTASADAAGNTCAQSQLSKAFAFGADAFTTTVPGTSTQYMKVIQNGTNFIYSSSRGYGYTDTTGIDKSPNNRGVLSGNDEIYDQFIGAKGGEGKDIVFRVNVPNGTYRFVAAGGDAQYSGHGSTIKAKDGATGAEVTLVQRQVLSGNQYYRVGFDGKAPPAGDGQGTQPAFLSLQQSPTLTVTSGYVQIRQVVEGGTDGGDLCLLELWQAGAAQSGVVRPVLEGITNNCNGTYSARFGYENTTSATVTIPVGSENQFIYLGQSGRNMGQPTEFLVGRHSNVFSVNFNGSDLVWRLRTRTSTASGVHAQNSCN